MFEKDLASLLKWWYQIHVEEHNVSEQSVAVSILESVAFKSNVSFHAKLTGFLSPYDW